MLGGQGRFSSFVVAFAFLAVLAAPAAEARSRAVTVTTEFDRRERGAAVPRSFLGFSMEYNRTAFVTGSEAVGVNPVTVGLFRTLSHGGNGAPTIRLGGASSDFTRWNENPRRPQPAGIRLDLNSGYAAALGGLVRHTGSPLILGLNLRHNDPTLSAEVARELISRLPPGSVQSFEIGNEPDLYAGSVLVRNPDGSVGYARPQDYDVQDWNAEIGRHLDAVGAAAPGVGLAGPAATCNGTWCPAAREIVRQHGAALDWLTYHTYPLNRCRAPRGSIAFPTIENLLSPRALQRPLALRPVVKAARAGGVQVRISETNSAACGGANGVSNVFASALWGADLSFLLTAIGVGGVNFHTSSNLYAPFVTGYDFQRRRFVGTAMPLYYGMLLYARAVSGGARLLVRPTLGARYSRPANIRIWTLRRRRQARVVVINKETRRAARVQIRVPRARGRGTVMRLRARSLASHTGTTFAGQRVPRDSTDGRLRGRRRLGRPVRPRDDVYTLSVPAGSAALMTVRL